MSVLVRVAESPLAPCSGIRFAAAHVPWDTMSDESGDWYDVLAVSGGGTAFVVGDAVGRGPEAAPLQEELRAVVRCLAGDGATGPDIVAALRAMLRSDFDAFATLVYAVLSPHGRLTITNAGHPPPLLLRGRSARFLSEPVAPALGVPVDGDGTATAWLGPGDIVVLYTDGLVEHARLDMETGLRRLADTARRRAGVPLESLCAELVGLGFDGPQPADDLTALAFGVEDHTRQGGPQC